MQPNSLPESLAELTASLQRGHIDAEERARLESLRARIEASLNKPAAADHHNLLRDLNSAVERAEGAHPDLTSALSRVLDALSNVGV